jgi:tetratricopeptide (TPR) repeat protein
MHDGNQMITRSGCNPWNKLWFSAADEMGVAVACEGVRPWALMSKTPPPPPAILAQWKQEQLETVRQYAAERLAESGELEHRRALHAAFFAALAAEAEPHLITPQRPRWIAKLQLELENIRQALTWSRAGDAELHMRLVGMLHWFWFATGQWPEARQWLRSALTVPNAERRTRDRAAVLFSAGSIATAQGRAESARVHLVEAESIAEEIGDARLLAYIRNYLGVALSQIADHAAEVPAQLAFPAVAIPAGEHRVEWAEEVPGLAVSRWGPALFVLCAGGLLLRTRAGTARAA